MCIFKVKSLCNARESVSYTSALIPEALGYQSQEEFEQQLESTETNAGATMSSFRHGENYRPDGAQALRREDSVTRSGPQTASRR